MKKKPSLLKSGIEYGAKLIKARQFNDAAIHYGECLKIQPKNSQFHYCMGVAFHFDGKLQEAVNCYKHSITLNPNLLEAFENLAEACTELDQFDDALLHIRSAIKLNPVRSSSHLRLARILNRLGKFHDALDAANHAHSLDSNNAAVYKIRSNTYRGLNLLKESIADLRHALTIEPSNAELTYNMSFDLLLSENFEEGWQCYESRFQTENFLNNTPKMVSPKWNGIDSLEGKTILVCPEQGLGDQIQFARYALVLLGLGAKVIMPVAPALVDILQSMHPEVLITSSLEPASSLPAHNYYIPLMSLLGIFKTDLNNIPYADRYITPSPFISDKWARRFDNKTKLQIGITWSGSQLHVNDHNRSMGLAQLLPLFNLDVDWHVLQTDIRSTDELLLSQTVLMDWRHELSSLHETAGLIDQLDLLITVDTSVAHLSAALGKPTWIMLPFAPDFRWLLNRKDSPWYPTVHLFRQPMPQDWASVITNVYDTLTSK
jgi:hypothetical protein